MKKLKKISFDDFIGIFKFLVLIIPSYIRKRFSKKELWLISEHYTARDNGYFFYKYMRENHKEITCYYAMDTKSADYKNAKDLGNIIEWGSFKHYYYFMSATKNISAHKNGVPNHPLFGILLKYFGLYNNRIFLQHGITQANIPNFYYKNAKFKLFICGAKKEYDYIQKVFGYPEENVKYTGFARFDNLHNISFNKKQILLMPTWRRWINSDKEFLDSTYYKKLQSLINNKDLEDFLDKEDLYLDFCPHFGVKDYAHNFTTNSERIRLINPEKANIQELLTTSALLITDFSSVNMDFAYMEKPLIYYQFDLPEFREKHLQEGYFSYENDGFGDVLVEEEEVIKKIKFYIENNLKIEEKYMEKIEKFFPLRDEKNCERIYSVILAISK